MVWKTFNIFSIFNISAVSSTFFFNIQNLELTFLTFLQFRALFSKKWLETAEMLKMVFGGWVCPPMVQKTFNIFNTFNISAVSSTFFLNIQNLELTF